MAKQINARIQHKIGTAAEWELATTFIPLKGELIIYSDGKGGESKPRLKIGDGTTKVGNLPFLELTGEKGDDGYTPVKGTDYWTDEDKNEIVSAVINALPVYNGEVE